MDIIQAIIIGLVQGLTEFLPVSSSAHLIFAQQALGVADVGLAFDVLLHVGTLVAVIVYFFNDIKYNLHKTLRSCKIFTFSK